MKFAIRSWSLLGRPVYLWPAHCQFWSPSYGCLELSIVQIICSSKQKHELLCHGSLAILSLYLYSKQADDSNSCRKWQGSVGIFKETALVNYNGDFFSLALANWNYNKAWRKTYAAIWANPDMISYCMQDLQKCIILMHDTSFVIKSLKCEMNSVSTKHLHLH